MISQNKKNSRRFGLTFMIFLTATPAFATIYYYGPAQGNEENSYVVLRDHDILGRSVLEKDKEELKQLFTQHHGSNSPACWDNAVYMTDFFDHFFNRNQQRIQSTNPPPYDRKPYQWLYLKDDHSGEFLGLLFVERLQRAVLHPEEQQSQLLMTDCFLNTLQVVDDSHAADLSLEQRVSSKTYGYQPIQDKAVLQIRLILAMNTQGESKMSLNQQTYFLRAVQKFFTQMRIDGHRIMPYSAKPLDTEHGLPGVMVSFTNHYAGEAFKNAQFCRYDANCVNAWYPPHEANNPQHYRIDGERTLFHCALPQEPGNEELVLDESLRARIFD